MGGPHPWLTRLAARRGTRPEVTADLRQPAVPDADLAAEVLRGQVAAIQLVRRPRTVRTDELAPALRSALAAVVKYGPLRAGEVATREGVDPAAISRTLSRLDRAGLIRRTPAPDDRRVALVRATAAGRRTFQRDRARTTKFLMSRIRELDESDTAAIVAAAPALESPVRITETGPAESTADAR